MTQTRSLLRAPCYYLQQKENFVLRRCSWKKKYAKSLPSGAVCPCQPKRKSTDYKPAEHIHSDIKCILKFCLFSRGNYSVSPAWSARPTTGAEQDQLPCGSTGTSSDNCQERKTCMVLACHTPWQPLHNILQGMMNCGRRRGRQRKYWMDNIEEWTFLPLQELLTRVSCKKIEKDWKRTCAESSLMSPRRSVWSRDWTKFNYILNIWIFSWLKMLENDSERTQGTNLLRSKCSETQ